MGSYLNPGNELFRKYIRKKIYVDKTGFIGAVNRYMVEENNCICVARPRRFGKSYAADMLAAYYDRGCDSRDLFKDFKIAQDPTFEEHLNRYDVLHINVKNFISAERTVSGGMDLMTKEVSAELKEYAPDVEFTTEEIPFMLNRIYNKTKIPFVVIIDEWDCPLREKNTDEDRKEDPKGLARYLDFICNLLKGEACVALAYMTGILPVKKSGSNSEANMFKEVSMVNADPFQEYMGFTEDEVKALCEKHRKSYNDIKSWYDGYTVNGMSIYNPNSVVQAVTQTDDIFTGYWTDTETYENLKTYIKTNTYGVQDVLVDLLAGKEVEVSTGNFANDTVTFDGPDDVLTLLIHLGYLTYDLRTKKARIPNREIRDEFVDVIDNAGLGNYDKTKIDSEKVFEATMRGDEKKVAEYVRKIHRMRTSKLEYNKEISLKFAIEFAYLSAEDRYSLVLEMPAGDGFADVGYIPLDCNNPSYPPMIVELKVDKSAEGAIGQALDSEYFDFLSAYHGEVILVGINYNSETKVHTCEIQRVVKE